MFKESYIKDNSQIKPDDEFLARLKENVLQEEKEVHIDTCVILPDDESHTGRKHLGTGKKWLVAAACFVFVCTLVFVAVQQDFLHFGTSLKTDLESVIHGGESEETVQENSEDFTISSVTEISEENELSEQCQQQYKKVCDLFKESNVVIYRTENFDAESGIEYLQKNLMNQTKLNHEERDELVGDILAEKYILTESKEEFEKTEYYVAAFEGDLYVYFLIGDAQYIYIEEVSEIQSVASNNVKSNRL